MFLTTLVSQSSVINAANTEPTLTQIFHQWVRALRDLQYSTAVSNLILALFAVVIIALGIFASWLALHPDKPKSILLNWRDRILKSSSGKKYSRLIEFATKRFNPQGAFGLSFIVSLILLGLGIWAFGSLLEEVSVKNEIISFDVPIMSFISAHRVGWLTVMMTNVTNLGNEWLIIFLSLASGLFFKIKIKSWRPLFLLLITVVGAGLLDQIFKSIVARPRPDELIIITQASGYAFPSGHAALTAFYGALAYLLARTQKSWEGRSFIWAAAIAVSFLVGLSRIYLGVHWPTDVLGGWILAFVWLTLLFTTTKIIEKTNAGKNTITGFTKESKTKKYLTAISTALQAFRRIFMTGPNGLTRAEVKKRIAQGQVNISNQRTSRSFRHILYSNIFTRFNAILGTMLILILAIGSPRDALFGLIIIFNTSIGIIQEIRAKWALDRLTLITSSTINVIREGQVIPLPANQIVLDDLIELHVGDQIPVDGVLLKSESIEIDESIITGESEHVVKKNGDNVYSGSFIVAGKGFIQALQVGEQAYIRRMASAAKQFSLSQSELRQGINRILKYLVWLLIPTGILLFSTQLLFQQNGWRDAVAGSVAGISEMIPDGLVLLTSTVMAIAVIRLARAKALVQELAAVEILARVDVLCLDKTGTLTEGKMELEKIIELTKPADNASPSIRQVLGIFSAVQEPSVTLNAIAASCPTPSLKKWKIITNIPFDSDKKWSAISLEGHGSWILGSPEPIIKNEFGGSPELVTKINALAEQGFRVMILAYTNKVLDSVRTSSKYKLPGLTPLSLIILKEKLRPDVAQTLKFFAEQGVKIKIISGDNPKTVAAVASAAGLKDLQIKNGSEIPTDLTELGTITEKNNIFGRVTPEQKKLMVQALRKNGHTVAMIGDGVNDILAIKEANFGIAMGSGTGSNRAIAQLILIDNNFNVLPKVIAEGRRIIANIERTANFFLTKTTYVFAMALAVGVAQVPFPFLPRQLTFIGFFTIGLPALLLSLSQNTTRTKTGFVGRVLRFSLPAGGIVAAIILLTFAIIRQINPANISLARSAATFALLGCGLSVLYLLAKPQTFWQKTFVVAWLIIIGSVIILAPSRQFFALIIPPIYIWGLIVGMAAVCFFCLRKLKTKILNQT